MYWYKTEGLAIHKHFIDICKHTHQFNGHAPRDLDSYHTSRLTRHVLLDSGREGGEGRGKQWRESTFHERYFVQRFCGYKSYLVWNWIKAVLLCFSIVMLKG